MRIGLGVAAMALMAGCSEAPRDMNAHRDGAEVSRGAGTPLPAPASTPDAPSPAPVPAPSPSDAPPSMPETPVADDDGAQAAAGIVERYFALIEAGRFAQAYDLWEPQAASVARSRFRASFAQYAEYHATVGAPGRVDAGAGQRYVTVRIRTYGKLSAGGAFARNGSAILHRTADIDGATAAQRSWRIRSIELQPATPSAR